MDMQDKCVPCRDSMGVPKKRLFAEISSSSDDDIQLKEELASSANELLIRVRKPYTITKQRERWTEEEHEKFLEAIRLHGRAWHRIQEHIGTKTSIQIRSHAQKFFSKVDHDSGTGKTVEIPPPRPKRKPLHPYPRKLDHLCTTRVPDMKQPEQSCSPISSFSEQESGSPVSVLSAVGSDTLGSPVSKPPNSCASALSSMVGSDPVERSLSEPGNGCCSPTSSVVGENRILSLGPASNTLAKPDESPLELDLGSKDQISPVEGSPVEAQPTSLKLFGRTFLVTNSQKSCSSDDGNVSQCFKPVPSDDDGSREEKTDTNMQNRATSFVHFPAHGDVCGIAGKIASDGVAPSMYYFFVPNSVQMNSTDEIIAPGSFWRTFHGSLPFPFTKQLIMRSEQDLPQPGTVAPTQIIAQKEGSSIGSSSGSAWNESIMDDGNHTTVVGSEGSGLPKEPTCAFRLKPSENSAFVSVEASNSKSARGFVPYERCNSGKLVQE